MRNFFKVLATKKLSLNVISFIFLRAWSVFGAQSKTKGNTVSIRPKPRTLAVAKLMESEKSSAVLRVTRTVLS